MTFVTIGLWKIRDINADSDLIGLAFGMVAYTFGPLLGVLLAAIFLRGENVTPGLIIGSVLSILFVSYFRNELLIILGVVGLEDLANMIKASRPPLVSEWFFPINAGLTFLCGFISHAILGRVNVSD